MSSAPLWTLDAMAQAMRAERAGALPAALSGISIDSRTIGRGEAFFAIKGDARDGHEFVPAALANGAALAVVAADRRDAFPKAAPLLIVPDVLDGLRDLARASRARSSAKIIGVTGSVGKTGTKEALRLALSPSGETHASVASYNNHWGVPLSLARCPESARFAVFEMGMNHAGEIEPLSRLVQPHIAIITTIAPVHLEYLGSIEAIADAKAEIFRGLVPGGAAVINRDITAIRAPAARRRRCRRHANRVVRRARGGRCAAHDSRRCIRTARPRRRASSAATLPTSSARRAAITCSIRWRCWRRSRSPAPTSRLPRLRSPRCSRRRAAAPAARSICRAAARC